MDDASAIREEIRKETVDIYNRLHSINEDITFINNIHEVYSQFPIIPNLRCGLWYVDPELAQGQFAYFKSTDGHYNNWAFNLRRPNLHLLPILEKSRGVVLVDSTRSGKKFPDALSKTVPIWCEVINRAISLQHLPAVGASHLRTPASCVSAQEHHQMEFKIDGWAKDLAASFIILFATSTRRLEALLDLSKRHCVSIRGFKKLHPSHMRVCLQGSADDHELWSMGLQPHAFWKHMPVLMQAPRRDLHELVKSLVSNDKGESSTTSPVLFAPSAIAHVNGRIQICSLQNIPDLPPTQLPGSQLLDDAPSDATYVLIDSDRSSDGGSSVQSVNANDLSTLRVHLDEGKRGQDQFLRIILPSTLAFIGKHLQEGKSVVIACNSGKDASVGVAVAAIQRYFDDDGHYSSSAQTAITKQSIRTRLQWIIASRPEANPSRTTLKRVNEFLLTPTRYQA